MSEQTFRYTAFVSYRHTARDRFWAIRIMRALETYQTPKPLRRQGWPGRIGHLFRDEDEIPASSDLTDQIRDALAHSEFLIVVCSPDTSGSRWVRREIELFQEMGKGDRIIPLLIAGEPEDSFPPELLRRPAGNAGAAWEEIEPTAADVRPRPDESRAKTERRALLRLAAALLGCRFDDLARRDEERRRASLRGQLAAAAMLLLTIGGGATWWWSANFRVTTEYCANYGERRGEPFCAGPLTGSEQAARTTSYRLRLQAGHVRELARINGAGGLVDHQNTEYEDEPWTKGVALWRFTYAASASPRLASVTLVAPTGVTIREIGYEFSADGSQAITRFDRALGVAERQTAAGSALGLSAFGANTERRRSSIGQHRLWFDANGLLLRRDFEPLGGGGTVADVLGAHGRAYAYDAAGLPAQIHSLDSRGQVLVERSGIADQLRDHDPRGDLVTVEWRDAAGHLAPNEQNFARVLIRRTSAGNVAAEEYQDPTRSIVSRADRGFARLLETYDARGNLIQEDYLGPDGKPVRSSDIGVARVTYRYDSRGNHVEEAYFGRDGKPVLRRDMGIAGGTMRYDEHGNLVEQNFVGLDGKPVLSADHGVARVTLRYDENGDQVEQAYFGSDGEPILRRDLGVARVTSRYDGRGNKVAEAYFGIDNQPMLRKDMGIAGGTLHYDERGNPVEQQFLGLKGEPVPRTGTGIARVTYSYDEHGNQVEEAWFDASGKPVLRAGVGAARVIWRYDERGNRLAEDRFDASGNRLESRPAGAIPGPATPAIDQEPQTTPAERARIKN